MKVVSVNISNPVTINWKGKDVTTGIYKNPVSHPILLETETVKADTVVDRRYHGGIRKACYLYSADHYDHWKKRYPSLDWKYGMFGENVTVSGLDEAELFTGSTYRLGEALVEITDPRQPCYKLGVRFGDQKVLKDFIDFGHPGSYIKVLEHGKVKKGDKFELILQSGGKSIKEIFSLLYEI